MTTASQSAGMDRGRPAGRPQSNKGKAAIALGEGSTTLAGASQNGVLAGLRHSF
jgi:hypothetical protein